MKISAGMIVFQAEATLPPKMLTLCVESMLLYVDEFIIVEGATAARSGHKWDGNAQEFADKNGHSTDGTIQVLDSLKKKYPDKIKLIVRDGFWNGKTEMCNAYASVAKGDYIWHIDSDEFYHEDDIHRIEAMLNDRRPTAVHFYAEHFYGDFENVVDDIDVPKWANVEPWRRIFANGPGSRWKTHEPPNYVDASGRSLNDSPQVITREDTRSLGIFLYHYSQVCRSQAYFKAKFFNKPYDKMFDAWQLDHSTPLIGGAKTRPFFGTLTHPQVIRDNYL